ncbi:alpha-amylase A type-3 precursor [Pochonia chlamydosporia 170]|uniref:Alpha-amylase A type-3 n=1 Tax=Pochonia chlamydosporia 170 TaxID=1380566 RepID=A0A179F500_METCM|nr:alpha-amylase A type-3 precursor [Pochonia chlamydosporia 170]OAQ60506.1 alpha-amylase A type-3 precursor [Pochonia chlamydosporia 170]
MKISLPTLTLLAQVVYAADKNAWKSRSIYFALTDRIARSSSDNGGGSCGNLGDYCGGTFQGLQGKLDYIKGMGFDAIWITPIVANSDGGYHGYWAKDLYSVNAKYGSADDLKNLVNAAHDKQMYVMIDVVANHMGPSPLADRQPSPLNEASSYHTPCQIDYSNQTSVENCQISNLPDLDTQSSTVRTLYQDWIKWLIKEYAFDGVRIDTVKHVEHDFWTGFTSAAGVYTIGEVFDGDPSYVAGYANSMSGLLNYPVYYPLNNFYQQKGSSQALVDMHDKVGSLFPDASAMGTFLDNHDNARFLNQKNDVALLKNSLTYVLLARGVPIVYYGTEQAFSGGADPANREDLWRSNYSTGSDLYGFIAKVLGVKKAAGGLGSNDHTHLFVDSTAYAWSRENGTVMALTSNIGGGKTQQYCFGTKVPNGRWMGALDGKTYSADGDGKLCASVDDGAPVIFVS